MKKPYKIILGVFIGVASLIIGFIIFAISIALFTDYGDEASAIVNSSEVSAKQEVNKIEKSPKTTLINEELKIESAIFKVNGLDSAINIGEKWGIDSKGEFLIVDVSITNRGNKAITIDSSQFKLLSGEKTYESDSSAGLYANEENDFFYQEINPDLTLSGYIVFDIPPEAHGEELILQIQTGSFGKQIGLITLK